MGPGADFCRRPGSVNGQRWGGHAGEGQEAGPVGFVKEGGVGVKDKDFMTCCVLRESTWRGYVAASSAWRGGGGHFSGCASWQNGG
eukprot:1173806-Rhodomonas_salina.2